MTPGPLNLTVRRGVTFTLALTYCTARRPPRGWFEDAAMAAGSAALACPSAAFTAADVGLAVTVAGAGPAGADLTATVTAVAGDGTATLSAAASATVSGARCAVYRPVDLTGYAAKAQARDGAGTLLCEWNSAPAAGQGLLALGGPAGTLTLTLVPSVAAALPAAASGVWGLRLTGPDGTVSDLLEGSFVVEDGTVQ